MSSSSQTHVDLALKDTASVHTSTLEKLLKAGIDSVLKLLLHYPSAYTDRSRTTSIAQLEPGKPALIHAQVVRALRTRGKRPQLLCTVQDPSGQLQLRWFHHSPWQWRKLQQGGFIEAYGEPRSHSGRLELLHPEYSLHKGPLTLKKSLSWTAHYPTLGGLTSVQLRSAITRLLKDDAFTLSDYTSALAQKQSMQQALRLIHSPNVNISLDRLQPLVQQAKKRLALEELVAHQLSHKQRAQARSHYRAIAVASSGHNLTDALIAKLDFSLTGAQKRVLNETLHDLNQTHPCHRLIQGDVGSGKTIIAALAAARCLENQCQVVVMAPTELLAEQHYHNFSHWFLSLGIDVGWLSGTVSSARRKKLLVRLRQGELGIVIGTQAVFQDPVKFHRLALVIVDEQHRFGVNQRLALLNKGMDEHTMPHQLIMTATPIPRSLMMAFFGDVSVSSIDEMPPGRKPVQTVVIPATRRNELVERIAQVCARGEQSYWVCPFIEESEGMKVSAAQNILQLLQQRMNDLRIGLIHGKMKSQDKERILQRFRDQQLDILVATTIVEVGVDVPTATLMIIENAERMGLAQLHQLRGRVGRGSKTSYCVLIYEPPLSMTAHSRLSMIRNSHDGFEIARRDLELRGPGELFGVRQTGVPNLLAANFFTDQHLLQAAKHIADRLDPQAHSPLLERWIRSNQEFADV